MKPTSAEIPALAPKINTSWSKSLAGGRMTIATSAIVIARAMRMPTMNKVALTREDNMSGLKLVPHPPHRLEQVGARRIALDLLPQSPDMHGHSRRVAVAVITPDLDPNMGS